MDGNECIIETTWILGAWTWSYLRYVPAILSSYHALRDIDTWRQDSQTEGYVW